MRLILNFLYDSPKFKIRTLCPTKLSNKSEHRIKYFQKWNDSGTLSSTNSFWEVTLGGHI